MNISEVSTISDFDVTSYSPSQQTQQTQQQQQQQQSNNAFNRKKKKRKGFFKSIGFKRLYRPLVLICFFGSILYATVITILSIIFPTVQYCNKISESCRLKIDSYAYDITILVIGVIWAFLMLIIDVSLLLAPGYILYPHPRRVKIAALFSLFLLFWPTGMIISPLATRRYVIVITL
jgi:hypothetical protein